MTTGQATPPAQRRWTSCRPLAVIASVCCVLGLIVAVVVVGSGSSHSTYRQQPHGDLTDRQYAYALAVAHHEADRVAETVDSATAVLSDGVVEDSNTGQPCTSGTLIRIRIIGTFPTIAVGGVPTTPGSSQDTTVTAADVTVDGQTGEECLFSVRTGYVQPEPGATVLFTS